MHDSINIIEVNISGIAYTRRDNTYFGAEHAWTSSITPMLHEVATSDLDLTTIVNPVRKLLRRVQFLAGEVERIDIARKQVVVSHGFDHHQHTFEFDYLVIGLGSVTNLIVLG